MSEFRRFFALPHERDGEKIHLKSQFNHMAKVLRMKGGEKVIVCFDDSIDHLCVVESIDDDTVHLKIQTSTICPNENHFQTTLFVGAMKGDKNQFVVQKSIELGANCVSFFDSKFAVAKFDTKKIQRFNKISEEASKQCGRASITPVQYVDINQMTNQFKNFDLVILCNEHEKQTTLHDALSKMSIDTVSKSSQKIAVITGSEGGFSIDEIEKFTKSGAVSITLGKRILRAETAPIYMLSVLNFLLS